MEIKIKDLITDKISGEWGDEAISSNGVNVIRTANFTNLGILIFQILFLGKLIKRKLIKSNL